ncbi:hypothetical protein [Nocardia seriolae]|uniref:Uncharacterized protein n=1 Tax=Nocardia seriolae TaxID=37332 RepID=A0ABC8B385_9NOCA|nr:hypothetical protein [Nocardia seriolae]APB00628.1 hypothetical protein NS506_06597 [Nocardia seriolae]MTJ61881.1 hypothetical protein [Nocardia seriolae]MTJ74627.1 hypothetical protein [Nocardia seriolae]MTJ90084.1 hypothetical protein [Nocardia seriolae]MTK34049.1 hypothetical protein [Nocardia seriolae]
MAKHRRQTVTQRVLLRAAVSAIPMTAALGISAVAHAAPQPGVTQPDPGSPNSGGAQPGVTVTPPTPQQVSPQDDAHGVAPQSDYAPTRPDPKRDYSPAPIQPGDLHAPTATPDIGVIVPTNPRELRAGDLTAIAPDFLSDDQVAQINSALAGPEAQISQFTRSIGVAPSRSDHIAAGALAGAAGGALVGCIAGAAIATLPAGPLAPIIAPITAPPGCVIGGVVGLATGAVLGAGAGALI